MKHIYKLSFFLLLFIIATNGKAQLQTDTFNAKFATIAPVIDGDSSDICWTKANWYYMNNVWLPWGTTASSSDFYGRYKLSWDADYLYIMVEVTDNVLFDDHPNLFNDYWTGDCVEIFIDENSSKGNHQYNYNAFAYHCGPKGIAVDYGTSTSSPIRLDNNLILDVDTIATNKYLWEFAVKNYSSSFNPANTETSRIQLAENKIMGFTLAYCDNDGTNQRENFFGSMTMTSGTSNSNYITADYFGSLKLIPEETTSGITLVSKLSALIYPNPVSDVLTINLNNQNATDLRIINAIGQSVKLQGIKGQITTVDVSKLNSGLYFVEVLNNGNRLFTRKIEVK
jgi:hypothetical protein